MRRKGFTMIELVAATALAALLFTVAVSVIRSLGRISTGNELAQPVWTLAVRQQLDWDLANAVVFRQDNHGLTLAGYGSLDRKTLQSTHLQVTVVYSLRQIGSQSWLVREQSGLEPRFADSNWSELLCGHVKTFAFAGTYAARTVSLDSTSSEDAAPAVFRQLSGFQPTPDRARVKIDWDDQTPSIDDTLFLK